MSDYLFDDAAAGGELERLRTLEGVFDPRTTRYLSATGDWSGRHALEVGAGAGSIARWMRDRVGEQGRVVAVDTNTRFLTGLGPDVEVVQGDIGELSLARTFDVVHARYVLIHNAEPGLILDALLRCLKPGGWLLLEEPDFVGAHPLAGPASLQRAFSNVAAAVEAAFKSRGMDPGFGRMLSGHLCERAVDVACVEVEPALEPGGSALARMMALSTAQLAEKYLATGLAVRADIDGYRAFAADPLCWGHYYATVRVLGRKAA